MLGKLEPARELDSHVIDNDNSVVKVGKAECKQRGKDECLPALTSRV